MPVALRELLAALHGAVLSGAPDVAVSGITDDSRTVKPGWLFAAHTGEHTDGHRFIPAALASGAVAVLHRDPVPDPDPAVGWVRVPDVPAALSAVSARFHGEPGRSLVCLGVTGTKGKTTTTWFLTQLLAGLGRGVGMISSALLRVGDTVSSNPSHVSTPMAYDLHHTLRRMLDAGNEIAVVECSSHGLSYRTSRLLDVPFDGAVLTNVTHEHLDFHGTMDQYRSDKANLFRVLGSHPGRPVPAFGVVNADDGSAEYFRTATTARVLSYSVSGAAADLRAEAVMEAPEGTAFELREAAGSPIPARLGTPGLFNLSNLLAALAAARALTGEPLGRLAALVAGLSPVKGRMERIAAGQPFEVIVDFAHNPDSFEKLLSTMRRMAPSRLIAVFGSGGERDRAKRPLQGEIAGRYCEVVILADEDPRDESPLRILREIAAGCGDHVEGQDLFLIPDRTVAIRHALRLARKGDTVLLLGKGHETSILYADHSIPWDEAAVARSLLAEMGYRA